MQQMFASSHSDTQRLRVNLELRPAIGRWLLIGILAAGLTLRLVGLMRPGLHPDEALYASWALRVADGSDPALLAVYVDKPPLWLYLLAGLFRLAGVGTASSGQAAGLDYQVLVLLGRLAGVVAGTLSLLLLYDVARRLYGRGVALLALAFYAVSPLAARFSPTLFTDPWLVLWMLLGLWAALRRQSWLTGIACGLAYATKQQAVLLVPLVLATFILAWTEGHRLRGSRDPAAGPPWRVAWRLVNGFLLIFALVVWWDSLRWQWMPSYWERSLATYGGLRLAWEGFGQRVVRWGELLNYVFGPLLAMLGLLGLLMAAWGRAGQPDGGGGAARRVPQHAYNWLLAVYVLAYLALHWMFTFATWDRYALPLVPLLALLLARVWASGSLIPSSAGKGKAMRPWHGLPVRLSFRGRRWGMASWVTLVLLVIALLHAGWLSAFGALPVADATAYDGVASLARYLRETQQPGTVLYHRWLGWHYGFYLYNAPLELRWWADAGDLAAKAARDAQIPQLIAFPAGRDETAVRQALQAAGLRLELLWRTYHADGTLSLTLYAIRSLEVSIDDGLP